MSSDQVQDLGPPGILPAEDLPASSCGSFEEESVFVKGKGWVSVKRKYCQEDGFVFALKSIALKIWH